MRAAFSRRQFLRQATLAGTAISVIPCQDPVGADSVPVLSKSPNEKLNIGVIGVAARGASNLSGVSSENIVALCDIDSQRLGMAMEQHPSASAYDDYRRVIDHSDLDCVVVSTPDHMHFFPVIAALQAGFDVYCEKPLAHSVWEARHIREWTARQKAVTQLGTQIHAGDNYRRAVEIVQSGALGAVTRVHVWYGGKVRVFSESKTGPVPPHINYDLWTGPAPMRPFSSDHFHFNWRYWWDFGNGNLGDFGCHYMDLPHWALQLRAPETVQASGEKGHEGDNECPNHMRVDYRYPARDDLPPVHLTWYQGDYRPSEFTEYGDGKGSAGLFEGEKGRLLADYGSKKVFMTEGSAFASPAPTIPNSLGHHAEFIEAVKHRDNTTCNFDYSGALTETVLLGNVSYRLGGEKLVWDDLQLRATNCGEADSYIRREYRKGWSI